MDQESEKTRAELLDELTGSREDFFSPEAVEAIFPLLPGNGSEKLSVEEAKRLEREYLLLCGRGGGCVADTTAPVSHSEHLENEEDGSAPGVKGTGFEPLCGRLVEASDEGGVDALYQAVADEAAADRKSVV